MAQVTSAYPVVPKPESIAPRRLVRPESCGSCCSREAGNCGTWVLVKRDALWDELKRFVKAVVRASFAQILFVSVCLIIGFFAVYVFYAACLCAPYNACIGDVAAHRARCVAHDTEHAPLSKAWCVWNATCTRMEEERDKIVLDAIPLKCDNQHSETSCLWSFPAYLLVAHFNISTIFALALAAGVELAPYKYFFILAAIRMLEPFIGMTKSVLEIAAKKCKKRAGEFNAVSVEAEASLKRRANGADDDGDAQPPALEQVQPAAAPVQTPQPAQDTAQHIPQPAQQRPTPSAPVGDDDHDYFTKRVPAFYTKRG